MAEKMDREEAAAFIHVSVTWRKQSESEKLDWCGRAARIIAQGFTQNDIGEFCGVSRQVVGERLAWSEALLKAADSAKLASLKREASIKRAERGLKQAAKTNPEQAAELFVEAVGVDAAIDAVAKAAGETRKKAPSNQAKVEQMFGPSEFNRLEDAIQAVLKRLPDIAPDNDPDYSTGQQAKELANDARMVAETLEAWAEGQSVADDVEAFLKEVSQQ